jgi:hypothetical protein
MSNARAASSRGMEHAEVGVLICCMLFGRQLMASTYVNDRELPNWKKNPSIYAWSKELGDQGWELVTVHAPVNNSGERSAYRLVFNRPKSEPLPPSPADR